MANRIIIKCFKSIGYGWFFNPKLVVGEITVDLPDVLMTSEEIFDVFINHYRALADGLGIELEIDQEVTDLRERYKGERVINYDA